MCTFRYGARKGLPDGESRAHATTFGLICDCKDALQSILRAQSQARWRLNTVRIYHNLIVFAFSVKQDCIGYILCELGISPVLRCEVDIGVSFGHQGVGNIFCACVVVHTEVEPSDQIFLDKRLAVEEFIELH